MKNEAIRKRLPYTEDDILEFRSKIFFALFGHCKLGKQQHNSS